MITIPCTYQTQCSRGCSTNTTVNDSLSHSSFVKISSKHLHSQTVRARNLKFWDNVHYLLCVANQLSVFSCQLSVVICKVSVVRCHVSSVICYMSLCELRISWFHPRCRLRPLDAVLSSSVGYVERGGLTSRDRPNSLEIYLLLGFLLAMPSQTVLLLVR